MNVFRMLYCRTFQTVFRMALPLLPYRTPEILTGTDRLPELFREKGIDRVLLVTDSSIRGLGITRHTEEVLGGAGIRCSVYDGTVANPTTDNVEEALALYRADGCEAIIGFGGGSSMDCAKAVGARAANPGKSLAKMEGILKVRRRLPLLVAVPTTAGTGSETTLAAVITDSETRHKYPINDFPLIPRYAVLDPEVTRGLPRHITATTGLDALTHAVEAYIGRSTTKGTRRDAEEAVRLIFANLERACSLGGRYNVPHGLANAVLLPYVLEDYGPAAWRSLSRLAAAAGLADSTDSPETGAKKMIRAIRELRQRLDIPEIIPEIRRADIPQLARYADKEANPLYPVPKLMDAGELERFYTMVMEEQESYETGRDSEHSGNPEVLVFQR